MRYFSPFEKGGRGDLIRQRCLQPSINRFNHHLGIRQDLTAIETHHCQTQPGKAPIALLVSLDGGTLEMLRSINFDDEIRSRCIKIHNVVADRLLAIELDTQQLLAPQARPQGSFACGHVLAQLPGAILQIFVVV